MTTYSPSRRLRPSSIIPVTRNAPACNRCRSLNRGNYNLHDQQRHPRCRRHRRTVQITVADRNLLQMDQAESQTQVVPRHLEKRRHDSSLSRHDLLPAALVYQVPDQMPTLAPRTDRNHRRTTAR